jgi:hypothetical protein
LKFFVLLPAQKHQKALREQSCLPAMQKQAQIQVKLRRGAMLSFFVLLSLGGCKSAFRKLLVALHHSNSPCFGTACFTGFAAVFAFLRALPAVRAACPPYPVKIQAFLLSRLRMLANLGLLLTQ